MSRAGRLVRAGSLLEATAAIQGALARLHGLQPAAPFRARGARRAAAAPLSPRHGTPHDATDPIAMPLPARGDTRDGDPPAEPGSFRSGAVQLGVVAARYKVFVPQRAEGEALPLVVMLHGCTQDPDDFAAGTRMNARADELGFAVLYPEQSRAGNPSRCWNWFRREDQVRGQGEPAAIVAMTDAVIAEFGLDARRVFIAGMSAGGAMAAIVAREYPERYRAVGIHSGLPAGAAKNVPDAMAVMRTGMARAAAVAAESPAMPSHEMPTIVFHGTADRTVHPHNGGRAVEAALGAARAAIVPTVENVTTPDGVRYSRSQYVRADGTLLAEHWLVRDGSHAWSGGDPTGSYTEPSGPSATDAMLTFFGLRH